MGVSDGLSDTTDWKGRAEKAEARVFCLEDTLRPFAMYADTMYHLKDDDKVAGLYVRWFRDAARVFDSQFAAVERIQEKP